MPHPVSPVASVPEIEDELLNAPLLSENGASQQSEKDEKAAPEDDDHMDIEGPPGASIKEEVCLDNMFDDDDENEAFPSDAPDTKPEVVADALM